MKKISTIVLTFTLFAFLGLGNTYVHAKEDDVLRIYNWQDYIDDGIDEDGNLISTPIIDLWAEDYKQRTGKDVRVVYDTFETNETMLNTLKTGKTSYDLVCPSDYVIQKMIKDEMIEKYDVSKLTTYQQYGSPYLKELFANNNWSEYAVPYMWGTMGLLYNPEIVDHQDVTSWDAMWNTKYENKVTTKDSVRDTYFVGVMHVYKEELNNLKKDYNDSKITLSEYTEKINEIMNRTDSTTLSTVENALKELKNNIFGLEVDSGKSDMVTGKIAMNLAWSGDAVYSMDLAEDEDEKLFYYYVPEEGSNVWYDGWVMPKGGNTELATDFVNYLCRPEIAVLNMNKIGYTSAIAGEAILEMIEEWYGTDVEEDTVEVDLTYFFGDTVEKNEEGNVLVNIDQHYINRQFTAQYPDFKIVSRCGIMEDFGEANQSVLELWTNFKGNEIGTVTWIIIGVVGAFGVGIVVFFTIKKNNQRKHRHH